MTRPNNCIHLVISDSIGQAIAIQIQWGVIANYILKEFNNSATLTLNSADARAKYLNTYYDFDLDVLIGTN